jgi:ankyrin repeat protein
MINQQDAYGRTPLHDACSSGRPESVHLLLLAGADITILDKNKRTPLHACAEFGDEQRLWELLSRSDETSGHMIQDRFRPAFGGRPGYRAWYAEGIYSRETKCEEPTNIGLVVKILLSAGSDIMAVDSHHQSPLDLALLYDCQEMIEALKFSALPLMKKWRQKPDDLRLPTLLALKKLKSSPVSVIDSKNLLCQEVYDNLSTYLRFLSFEDIIWISQNGGNITGFDESKPVPSSGDSLLYIAASTGLTQLVETFGTLARTNDDTETVRGRINAQLAINPNYNPRVKKLAPTLHVACGRELPNMDMIHILVDKCGVDVNAHALVQQDGPWRWANIADSIEGGTALHVLAKSRYWWQLEALRYLLDNGAKIDALNENGETPLHIACTGTNSAAMSSEDDVYGFWRIEAVKILLESGADISILDKNGLSCLHKASSSPKIMRILLENGADPMAGKFSSVFSAIQIQCLETLTILLDSGVSLNVTDPNIEHEGFRMRCTVKNTVRSALMCASFAESELRNQSEKHNAPMVKLLIERGADIYTALNEKQTLIHYVFEYAQFEIVDAFIESVKTSNIDLNTRDSLGRTVFIAACESTECLPGYQHKHWYPKVKAPFLRTLDLGADPFVLDNEGRNALHHLLDNSETEEDAIIQFLAHDSAKILLNQKDKHGFTPLNCALRMLRPAVIEIMLTMGQDLLSPDPTGATALHRIAEQCLRTSSPRRQYGFGREYLPEYYTGALTLWKKFLALGGSINVRDNKGAPPLFYFLSSDERYLPDASEDRCCHLEYFNTYFSHEVATDLNFAAKNENGENALHIIARREKDKLFNKAEGHNHVPTHDKDLYQFFMKKGLNALEEDSKGRSSLDVAAACDQKGILELFQYGK